MVEGFDGTYASTHVAGMELLHLSVRFIFFSCRFRWLSVWSINLPTNLISSLVIVILDMTVKNHSLYCASTGEI